MKSEQGPIEDNEIIREILQTSQFIVGTYELLAFGSIEHYLRQVGTIIIDDAHSQFELETLLALSLNPQQLILLGCEDLPRPLCFASNCSQTQFSKSVFTRLIEQDFNFLKLKS